MVIFMRKIQNKVSELSALAYACVINLAAKQRCLLLPHFMSFLNINNCGDPSRFTSKLTGITRVRKSARRAHAHFRHELLVFLPSYLQNPHQITDEWNSFIPPAVFSDYLPASDLKGWGSPNEGSAVDSYSSSLFRPQEWFHSPVRFAKPDSSYQQSTHLQLLSLFCSNPLK